MHSRLFRSRELIQKLYDNVDLICREYGDKASVYNTFYKKDALDNVVLRYSNYDGGMELEKNNINHGK